MTTQVSAQDDITLVKQTINNLFAGMRQSDGKMVRSAFTEHAILQSIAKSREGKTMIRTEDVDSFAAFVARPHTAVYDERIEFANIHIDGDLASVWTPYKFYLGDQFSHCGVNSFQLVKMEGEWKIQFLIDTRRKQPCE